jgi:putative surface cell wall-binding protein
MQVASPPLMGVSMHLLKSRSIRFYLVCFLILSMAIGGSAIAAFADSSTGATIAVNAGTLTESGPASVSATAVTLNGSDQTTTYSLGLTVTEARGSGAGWNLTITSTTFTAGTHSLSTSASSITAIPTVACFGGSTCTNPTNSITYPLGVPAAPTAPAAVKFFNAAANTGMGKFTITPTVTINIPANTFAGSYTSTVNVAVVSGP